MGDDIGNMFLGRAESCKKNGDSHWAKAMQAEADGKPPEEVEKLKKQAWHYYAEEKKNRRSAEENKGKSFGKGSKNKGDKNE